jgi:phage pi2 protein 07
MNKRIIREKLSWFRGNIISGATVIERALGWKLRTYFFPKTNQQASDFLYYIIETPHFSFDKKISLYEQIPYFKKLKQYSKVKNSLRFIQQLRNALAHWNLDEKMSNENGIVIYSPVTFKRLKLNNELMEKFQEHEKSLLKIFGWEQTLKEKYGTLRKNEKSK